MTARVLVDTNVLVYAYDRSEPTKQQRALDVLDQLATSGAGAITTQVLAEFFVTVTRKLALPLPVAEAYTRVENYLRAWTVYDITGLVVLEAVRGVRDYQLSFWDAQIWAAARLNQLPVIVSEDFNVGATLEGVRIVNPFAPAFELADWL
ncbi:MAG TPA: PIN domain-containing protein [Chloroflexaceae bacterium]|nr:PIN domain-containing protein [Chloroflexaceae bacterium]